MGTDKEHEALAMATKQALSEAFEELRQVREKHDVDGHMFYMSLIGTVIANMINQDLITAPELAAYLTNIMIQTTIHGFTDGVRLQ